MTNAGFASRTPARRGASAVATAAIAIVEEKTLLRQLLREFIAQVPGCHVAGDFAALGSAVDAPELSEVKLVVLCCATWDARTSQLVAKLHERDSAVPVLVIASVVDAYLIQLALGSGVAGVIDQGVGLELLERAIKAVTSGRQFLSPAAAAVWRQVLTSPTRGAADALTERERAVLHEIAQGRFSKEIATVLDLSVFTVENIRRRIMKKTGLRSVAELTLHAVRLGLAPPPAARLEVAPRK